jgi:putative Mn2+ efflux pump MntP
MRYLLLGVVIGANNFAAALALGALGDRIRRAQVLLVFAVFEFCIPLVGLWLGRRASTRLAAQADWLVPGLLVAVGVATIVSALRSEQTLEKLTHQVGSWGGLTLLAAGLSADNLVLGFGLGIRGLDPLLLALAITLFSVSFAYAGISLGRAGHSRHALASKVGAGCLLIGIGIAFAMSWL